MSRRGQVFSNPVTGERGVILTDPDDHPEGVLVGHLMVRPGGRVAAEHFHPTSTERFRVLRGRVGFMIDGREQTLGPDEQADVPPGVRHDWWQVGSEEAHVIVEVAPGKRFTEVLTTLWGLAQDGKVDKRGLPHPLQLAVTAAEYRDTVVFTSPPRWVQRVMFGLLAPAGRALGRRPSYAEYLQSSELVEPDQAALGLLTPAGRLASRTDAMRNV